VTSKFIAPSPTDFFIEQNGYSKKTISTDTKTISPLMHGKVVQSLRTHVNERWYEIHTG
jgi:hypothetical protein